MAGRGAQPGTRKRWWREGGAARCGKGGNRRQVKADRLHTRRRGLIRRELFSEERAECPWDAASSLHVFGGSCLDSRLRLARGSPGPVRPGQPAREAKQDDGVQRVERRNSWNRQPDKRHLQQQKHKQEQGQPGRLSRKTSCEG